MLHQSFFDLESFWFLALALVWIIPWKGWALWRAARNEHKKWFVALLVVNTFAFLEILYIFLFSGYKRGTKTIKGTKGTQETKDIENTKEDARRRERKKRLK